MATAEAVVRDACRVIWTEGEVGRVREFYADNLCADYPGTNWGKGAEGVERLAAGIRAGFPDYREQIDELFVDGDNVIVRLTIRGIHLGAMGDLPATGRKVEFRDVSIIRVVYGKIVEQRGLTDYLTLYQQLGVIELPG